MESLTFVPIESVAGAPLHWTLLPSPVGDLLAVERGGALVGLHFTDPDMPFDEPDGDNVDPDEVAVLAAVRDQLGEYFAGRRRDFDLVLAMEGTQFQREVWEALTRVDYGHTASYRDIAEDIGRPTATRAVGAANGVNPVPVVVPCHRVIGADGSLTGYGGGLHRKELLLALESEPV